MSARADARTHARVTFVHGFLGSPADWSDVLAHLAPNIACDCVSLEELGCASIAAAARALEQRLHARPADLVVGYSMGGRIALELAAMSDAPSTHAMLLSTSVGLRDESERLQRRHEDDERSRAIHRDGLDAFVDAWYRLPLFASLRRHPSFESMRARRCVGNAAFWADCVRDCSPGLARAHWEVLPHIAHRLALVAGAQDERYALMNAAAQRIAPSIVVHTIEDAGHALPIEAGARVAQLIEQQLQLLP